MNAKLMNEDINRTGRALYAAPVAATALLYGGPIVVLQGIYAKYFGIPLTTIAAILLVANLFDTITDPVIGYFSDRYYKKNKTRKPFIFWGGVFFIVAAYYLFTPPENATGLYFLICFLGFFLGFTLFNIPHNAWGSVLSSDSQSSMRIFTARAMALLLGGMLFYSLPQLPFFETTEFTPKTLEVAVYIAAILILPALYLCLKFLPDGFHQNKRETKTGSDISIFSKECRESNLVTLWISIKTNKALAFFLGSFFLSGIGAGSWGALIFIYVDAFLNKGEWFSMIALLGMGFGTFGLYIWGKVAVSLGKKVSWILATLVTVIGILSMLFLPPETASFYSLALIIVSIFIGINSFSALAPALLSDLIDYSILKSGSDFTGSFYAIYFLITKVNVAVGSALGLFIAGSYGFELQQPNSSASIMGLQLAAIWLPSIFLLISIFFIYQITIDTRRHAIIFRALERRRARQ